MDKTQLAKRVAEMRKSLIDQGYIDEYQFNEIEKLVSGSTSDAENVMTALFESVVPDLIDSIEESLRSQPPHDFQGMIANIDDLLRNCTAVGASKVVPKCFTFMDYCEKQNATGCQSALLEIKQELEALKQKLDAYFQVERQLQNT